MSTPLVYQIVIKEPLDEAWAEWFSPLIIQQGAVGDTVLSGPVRDQSELHGILAKVCNLNLTLVSVNPNPPPFSPATVETGDTSAV